MKVNCKGLAGLKVAKIFAGLVHVCRMNPLIIEREWKEFFQDVLNNLFLIEYSYEEIEAILSCVDDPDVNGIQPVDRIADIEVEQFKTYITAVFQSLENIKVIQEQKLWEGYPLNQAIGILMKKNPQFDIEHLLNIVKESPNA